MQRVRVDSDSGSAGAATSVVPTHCVGAPIGVIACAGRATVCAAMQIEHCRSERPEVRW